jgi:hypothetical protein
MRLFLQCSVSGDRSGSSRPVPGDGDDSPDPRGISGLFHPPRHGKGRQVLDPRTSGGQAVATRGKLRQAIGEKGLGVTKLARFRLKGQDRRRQGGKGGRGQSAENDGQGGLGQGKPGFFP